MTDALVPSPRLVTWENGTDLVIDLALPVEAGTVWERLADGSQSGEWFAPFTIGCTVAPEPADAEPDDSESAVGVVEFDLGEDILRGEILSYEEWDHVLIEFAEFGVLGLRLSTGDHESTGSDTHEGEVSGAGATSTDSAADPAGDPTSPSAAGGPGTVLTLTVSAPDIDSAREIAADQGPMWDTHLRLFARALERDASGAADDPAADLDEQAAEAELSARYSALPEDTADSAPAGL